MTTDSGSLNKPSGGSTQRSFLVNTGRAVVRAQPRPDGSWRMGTALAGRDVRCLASDPLRPGVCYAGLQGSGVMRSDDNGATWRAAGLGGQKVKSIAVSPLQPGVLYAGTSPPALFRSVDGGESWEELPGLRKRRQFWWFSPAEPPRLTPYVMAIALSPTDPNTLLAGIELGAVLRSDDGGQSWSGHRRHALRDCHSLAFNARHGDWVYEGGGTGGGAAFSQDAGLTFQKPRQGLDRHYGWTLAADPQDPAIWYLAASGQPNLTGPFVPPAHVYGQSNAGIYRHSTDGQWQLLNGGLPQPLNYMAQVLATDPMAPGHLYAAMANGRIWFSADHGDNWQQLTVEFGRAYQMLVL